MNHVIYIIFLVVTDEGFSALTVKGETFKSPSLYVELKENPKEDTHKVHWPWCLLKEFLSWNGEGYRNRNLPLVAQNQDPVCPYAVSEVGQASSGEWVSQRQSISFLQRTSEYNDGANWKFDDFHQCLGKEKWALLSIELAFILMYFLWINFPDIIYFNTSPQTLKKKKKLKGNPSWKGRKKIICSKNSEQ